MPVRFRLGLVAFAAAVLCGAALAAEDLPAGGTTDETVPLGSEVRWIVRGTPAGRAARIRLRGEVLEYILGGGGWELHGPGGRLPARLVLPPEPGSPVVTRLENYTTIADNRDLLITFDRGSDLFTINRLEVRLARSEVLCRATLATSSDGQHYSTAGASQLLYQSISAGQLVRHATLVLNDTSARYIRVRLAGQSVSELDYAAGWHEPEYSHPTYKLNAWLGTMRDGSLPGESVWPLLIEGETRPLLKLKVLADETETTRLIRLASLGQDDGDQTPDAQFQWIAGIASGGLLIDNRWLKLPSLEYRNDLALVVDDGERGILQLSGVEAYAAEVVLELVLPGQDGPEGGVASEFLLNLWQAEDPAQPALELDDEATELKVVAEFKDWSLAPEPTPVEKVLPVIGEYWFEYWWLRPAGLAFGALLLLLVAAILLRRPPVRY